MRKLAILTLCGVALGASNAGAVECGPQALLVQAQLPGSIVSDMAVVGGHVVQVQAPAARTEAKRRLPPVVATGKAVAFTTGPAQGLRANGNSAAFTTTARQG